jgi:hypothetical protein
MSLVRLLELVSRGILSQSIIAEARNLYRMPYPYILPPIALVSILWACWDPTWSHIQTARLRGVDLRVPGRETWNVRLEWTIWQPADYRYRSQRTTK